MARRSAIQQGRDRIQLEIENTEDALDQLVSFNYALMQEMEMDSQSDYSTDATGTDTDASAPTASSTPSEHLRSVVPASPLTHNITNGPSSISSSYHEPSSPPSPVSPAPESYAASSEYDGDAEDLDALKELRNDQFHSNYNSALAAEAHLEALRCEAAADLARQRYLNRAHNYTPIALHPFLSDRQPTKLLKRKHTPIPARQVRGGLQSSSSFAVSPSSVKSG